MKWAWAKTLQAIGEAELLKRVSHYVSPYCLPNFAEIPVEKRD